MRRAIGFHRDWVAVSERPDGDRVTHLSGMLQSAPEYCDTDQCRKNQLVITSRYGLANHTVSD
jgi:hypothetical protein